MDTATQVFEHLESIAEFIPTSLYWVDLHGKFIGYNSEFVKSVGVKIEGNAVGKTINNIFSDKEIANKLQKDIGKVISTKLASQHEYEISDAVTGKSACYITTIAPLRNQKGDIIGIICTAINTSSDKEAANLKLENEQYKKDAEEHLKFRETVNQVNHDIRSPLASLGMITKYCSHGLPENQRIMLRDAAQRIQDISSSMLHFLKDESSPTPASHNQASTLISIELLEILSEKRYEYHDRNIEFIQNFSTDAYFSFIHLDSVEFKRMISKIINNAVYALDPNIPGIISINLNCLSTKTLELVLEDNGQGMSKEVQKKILDNLPVTGNKNEGHGVGFNQIKEILENSGGTLAIESEINHGTKITLTFPTVAAPKWVTTVIEIHPDDLVIVLDDDPSIHGAWDLKLNGVTTHIKHFERGVDAIEFINDLDAKQKSKVLLLADYELLGQNMNGLDVAEKTKTKRSILVTSNYNNRRVVQEIIDHHAKLLPKLLASEVPLRVVSKDSKHDAHDALNTQQPSIVIVDDDKELVRNITELIFQGKLVDVYYDPDKFIANIAKYDKALPILIDHEFKGHSVSGLDICYKLSQLNFTNYHLYSGYDLEADNLPHYIKSVILKTDIGALRNLI